MVAAVITGAAGDLGQVLSEALLADGLRATAATSCRSSPAPAWRPSNST
jgi:NAD(P)-dependent dehydrogenase (short-subunit alcohol dehydrogenase family)